VVLVVSASRTIVVARPVGVVFGFFADAVNSAKWRSGVVEIGPAGPPVLGKVYRQRVRGPGGRAVSADVKVIELEPDRRVVMEGVSGPVRPVVEYTFESVGPRTRVTFTLSVELSGVKKVLMAGPVQNAMTAEVAQLSRAKELLEAETD
jgi:hypothetical protein